ncbi:hypothetical protein MP638_007186 [Amoeboaphelidium occidentale]|nr:hypothetical protein MP638_007186 [Amoeboaphelidium occidentale]
MADKLCTSSICTIIFTTVFPSVGAVTSTLLYIAPLQVVRNIDVKVSEYWQLLPISSDQQRYILEYNPIWPVLMFLNSLAWVLYSYFNNNLYVFFGNICGVAVGVYGIWVVSHALGLEVSLQGTQISPLSPSGDSSTVPTSSGSSVSGAINVTRKILIPKYTLVAGTLYILLGALKPSIMGIVANTILFLFYSSPLLAIRECALKRSNRFIHMPSVIATLLNTVLWFVYGSAINEVVIWLPNVVGAIVAISQLVCYMIFRAKARLGDNEAIIDDKSQSSEDVAL